MKKRAVFIVIFLLLLININTYAQCNLGVGIDRNPNGFVCRDVPVTYTAQPTGNPPNPQYVWVIDGDTVGTGATLTNTTPGEITIYMTSSSCAVPDTFYTNSVFHQAVFYEIVSETIVEECNQTVADVRIIEVIRYGGDTPLSYNLLHNGGLGEQELYEDLPVGNYPVYIEDDQGCSDTTWVTMEVEVCDPPTPFEAITPNGDGYNDTWIIANIDKYPNNEVFIFDRWGQRVYHEKGYTNAEGWEVNYMGVGLPVSTYYYVLKVTLEKGEDFVLKGAVSVFR